jgi:hypothetical protein
MKRETYMSQKAFAGEKKPSMHRRLLDHDYKGRQMYMVTLVVEGRRPLLGRLAGRSDGNRGSSEEPRLEPSQLGQAVAANFHDIGRYHPEVQVVALQLMPDHLHGILFVTREMEQHLGSIIGGFKTGCNKDYRRLFAVPSVVALPQHTKPALPQHTGPGERQRGPWDREHGLLFEPNYNDKVLLRAGQLERWKAYLNDNPRRLLAKREHPDLFRVSFGLHISGQTYAAIGNRFLLTRPMKRQVQYSRSLTPEQIAAAVETRLQEARSGSILVSPSLSDGEKAVMRAALNARLPLIFLSPQSFTAFTKPGGEFIEACTRGDLLILAPWPDRTATQRLTRQECLSLNAMAENICSNDSIIIT